MMTVSSAGRSITIVPKYCFVQGWSKTNHVVRYCQQRSSMPLVFVSRTDSLFSTSASTGVSVSVSASGLAGSSNNTIVYSPRNRNSVNEDPWWFVVGMASLLCTATAGRGELISLCENNIPEEIEDDSKCAPYKKNLDQCIKDNPSNINEACAPLFKIWTACAVEDSLLIFQNLVNMRLLLTAQDNFSRFKIILNKAEYRCWDAANSPIQMDWGEWPEYESSSARKTAIAGLRNLHKSDRLEQLGNKSNLVILNGKCYVPLKIKDDKGEDLFVTSAWVLNEDGMLLGMSGYREVSKKSIMVEEFISDGKAYDDDYDRNSARKLKKALASSSNAVHKDPSTLEVYFVIFADVTEEVQVFAHYTAIDPITGDANDLVNVVYHSTPFSVNKEAGI